jgi:hypothetical protein
VADLESGRSAPLAPGFQVAAYDISVDGGQVVMEAADREGKPRLWLTSFERPEPPHSIPNVEGRQPRYWSRRNLLPWRGRNRRLCLPSSTRWDGNAESSRTTNPRALRRFAGRPMGRGMVSTSGQRIAEQLCHSAGRGPPVHQRCDQFTVVAGWRFIVDFPTALCRGQVLHRSVTAGRSRRMAR